MLENFVSVEVECAVRIVWYCALLTCNKLELFLNCLDIDCSFLLHLIA